MAIDHLFKERWQREWRQYSKYLRYVFNDHAMLALLFLLGGSWIGVSAIVGERASYFLDTWFIITCSVTNAGIVQDTRKFCKGC